MASELDDTDERILRLLTADARLSMRTIAERAHISRANAYSRFNRLQAEGVIRGFTVDVDPVARGLTTSAYVTLNLRQPDWQATRDALLALPGVVHFAVVGGEFDVIMLVRARDNTALRDLVLERIQSMPGVISTRTLLVFDEQTTARPSSSAEPRE
ncbi:Lrp/AsnC family transcriptional regulator [Marmoricola sp. RAF53]|uniref:Lrp/AsnC family transcriptional regulator n=1 Tax=Marmoricola sp. RAF53 TaxID=3233059 RepID=UPI003F991A8B